MFSVPFLAPAQPAPGASSAAITILLPGRVKLDLVRIQAGGFLMGTTVTERSRALDEGPRHPVTLSHPFYLGRTEVTQRLWLALLGRWPEEPPTAENAPTGSPAAPGTRGDYAWYWFNCQGNAHGAYGAKPVASRRPNAWGLYDMSGNVWEWCQDWYGVYFKQQQTDPTGPEVGTYRVLRGGAWDSMAGQCRSAYRNNFDYEPDTRSIGIGFRVARPQ